MHKSMKWATPANTAIFGGPNRLRASARRVTKVCRDQVFSFIRTDIRGYMELVSVEEAF